MESWEFVQNNKELIRKRLIRYNKELGEYEFAKRIILKRCFQPKKKKEKIYVDKKNPSTWKKEKEQPKTNDRKYSKTRERLKNPLISNSRKNKKKNKNERSIEVPNNILDDLEVSLRVEKEIKEKFKRNRFR